MTGDCFSFLHPKGAAEARGDVERLLNQTLVSNGVMVMFGRINGLLFDTVQTLASVAALVTTNNTIFASNLVASVGFVAASLNLGVVGVGKQRSLTAALKHLSRFHNRTQRTTQPAIHIPKSDLITGIHPSKPLTWDKLEIDTDVPVFNLDFVGHVDDIELFGNHAVKVYK